ncbi:hypothetical protein RGL85_003380 [Acinetobacter baumannii]|nr:hypothetical protein [Acinetobacter baumannii]EMA4441376.1 hypothetical protein [Acinetobacter baumannii]
MSDHQTLEITITSFANKTTILSGVTSALASFNWLSYSGAIVAVAGLFISFIFQFRRDRRERRESELREKESKLRIEALEQDTERERKDE